MRFRVVVGCATPDHTRIVGKQIDPVTNRHQVVTRGNYVRFNAPVPIQWNWGD